MPSRAPHFVLVSPTLPVVWIVCGLCIGLLGGCGARRAAPEDTLGEFLEAMDDSATDVGSLKRAYELLDDGAQSALLVRARKAKTLSGRAHEGWEMLAQGRFRLRFAPAPGVGMRAAVKGDSAVVTVRGKREGQLALVPMVRQEGRWRVALAIPPLAQPVMGGAGVPAVASPGATVD